MTSLSVDRAVPLREATRVGLAQAGGKALTLARMLATGLAVPDGFVVTCQVWDEVRAAAGLGDDPTPEAVLAASLPSEVSTMLSGIGEQLGWTVMAVRSSAVDEDTAEASFAGQYDSLLDVRGIHALTDAVRRCWASAYSERVRGYRRARAYPTATTGGIAVLVQRQVDADVAGVASSADPVTGDRDRVLVSAVPGLGDVAVSGAAQPDEWVVTAGAATPVRVEHQALAVSQASTVADVALQVQAELGGPQEVEWAMADGRLFVLQARPLTSLPTRPQVQVPPGTWFKETERNPDLLTAFGASLMAPIVSQGLSAMFEQYGGLLDRMEALSIGGELYVRPVPPGGHDGPPPPWWLLGLLVRLAPSLRRRMRAAERQLRPGALAAVAESWRTRWRPDLQRSVARLRSTDIEALDDVELADHLDIVCDQLGRAMNVHFSMIPPYLVPVHDLVRTCARLLGWSERQALELLAGTSAATTDASRELAVLAADLRGNPAAFAARDSAEALAAVDPALAASHQGWCERHAFRNVHNDPGSPVLAETPWLISDLLNGIADPADRTVARAAAQAQARELLGSRPARDRDDFERDLAAALAAYPLREEVACWTGSAFGGCARLAAIESGRRLVARGLLEQQDDAVQLSVEALTAALRTAGRPDVRSQVRRARAERAWVRRHPGPPHHGPEPQSLPDLRGLPASGRRLNEALLSVERSGAESPSRSAVSALTVGVGASSGSHTGPVRVIRSVEEFGLLRRGDVLVCPTTDPAWSVLFAVAGALVTDGGGLLSHAAVIAREAAIPAVVGTRDATSLLHDGQVVTVDGAAGTVHLALGLDSTNGPAGRKQGER